MAMPGAVSTAIRKNTEQVKGQFGQEKDKQMAKIDEAVQGQISQVKEQFGKNLEAINGEISKLQKILGQINEIHPEYNKVVRQLGMLRAQKKQLESQLKLAISNIKSSAARQKENLKTNIEKQKQKAIQSTVNAILKQYSEMIAQKREEMMASKSDELKSGNRG